MRSTTFRISPTFVLIIINVAVYIYTSLESNNLVFMSDNVLGTYGQSGYAVLHLGQWWQLLTSMFVHVHIAHLASNMFFLLIFGLRAEDILPDTRYYTIYLTSGLAGNLLSLLLYPSIISAGASGALFGLFGAVIIYLRKLVEQSIVGALLFAFAYFIITISVSTNILAHLGGLITGLAIGYLLAIRREKLIVS